MNHFIEVVSSFSCSAYISSTFMHEARKNNTDCILIFGGERISSLGRNLKVRVRRGGGREETVFGTHPVLRMCVCVCVC